jgi:hypothetical protein
VLGGQLWVPHGCQCVDGKRRLLDADTIVPYSVYLGNAVLDALPEMTDRVMEDAAQHWLAAMGLACWAAWGQGYVQKQACSCI